MAKSEGKGLPTSVLIDRLLHASDSSDAQSSLESLLKNIPENEESAVDAITGSSSCLRALSSLIAQSSLPSGIELEEGQVTALELIQSVLKHGKSSKDAVKPLILESIPSSNENDDSQDNKHVNSNTMLHSSPLLHALLDCLCNSNTQTTSTYPRILSLEIITETHKLSSTLTQECLLSAPEGFHRLISLLHPNTNTSNTPESIRNATLLLLTKLSQNSSVIRKLLLFSEGYERVLGIAVNLDVNMEKAVVLDALSLCQNLLVEDAASDFGGCEMFFGGGGKHQVNVGGCVRLLDTRFFKHAQDVNIRKPIFKGSSDEGGDDLDDLLNSPSSKSETSIQRESFLVPRMTKEEEEVGHSVLDLFMFAMEVGEANRKDNSTQQTVEMKLLLNQAVMGAILSLALYSPFMETQIPYYASVPSSSLQCHALDILSRIVPDSESSLLTSSSSPMLTKSTENIPSLQNIYPLYEFFPGEASQPPLERLISLSYQEFNSLVSSHSRSCLRHILTSEQTNLIILHSLAPPPPGDDDQHQTQGIDPVVKEMIQSLSKDDITKEKKQSILYTVDVLLGNGNDTAKELFLRYPLEGRDTNDPKTLLTYLFETLEGDMNHDQNPVLHLLCSWSYSCPASTMHALLSFPQTLTISLMLENGNPLAAILLGLWLNYFTTFESEESKLNDSEAKENSNDIDISGWSKETIVQLIQRIGISKFTSLLDSFVKKEGINKDMAAYQISKQTTLKVISEQEQKEVSEVQTKMVSTIRKSLVSSITSSSSSSESQEMVEMTQMLEQYQTELSSFETKYLVEKELVSKQALEIKNLKLKYQPVTPVDEALAKQVDLTAMAENRVEELEKKLNTQKEDVSTLRKGKFDLEEEMKAEKQEKQDREEELTALSSAYNTLEEEYRKICVPSGNQDESGQEVQLTPLDIVNMKNELHALKEQVKAGDDWMSMAVERMNDMTAENVALQQQIADLQSSSAQSIEDKAEISRLNEKIETLNTDKVQLNEEKKRIVDEHAVQIEEMKRELVNLSNDLDVERSKESERGNPFSATVEKGAVERLEQKVDALLKELEEKENLCSSKEKERVLELARVQTECNDVRTAQGNELQKLKDEMEIQQNHHEVELKQKDMDITSLKKDINDLSTKPDNVPLTSAEDFFSAAPTIEIDERCGISKEEEHMLRAELEQLREAHDQAQEWMANAYGHQESMANDIELLKEENYNLKHEIEVLQNAPDQNSAKALNDVSSTKLNEEVNVTLKKEIEELKSNLDDVQSSKSQLEAKISELNSKTGELEGTQEDVEALKSNIANLKDIEAEYEQLKSKVDDSQTSLPQVETENSELDTVTGELGEAREEVEVLKSKVTDLQSDLENLKNKSEANLDFKSTFVDHAITSDYKQVKISCQNLQIQVDNLKQENKELLTEQESFTEAMDQLKSRLSEYQDWTKTAQDRISELEEERDQMESKYEDVKQTQTELEEKVGELTINISTLEAKLGDTEKEKLEVVDEMDQMQEKIQNITEENRKVTEQLQNDGDQKALILDKFESTHNKMRTLLGHIHDDEAELRNIANDEILKLLEEKLLLQCEKLFQSEKTLNDQEDVMKKIADHNALEIEKWKDEANLLQSKLHDLQIELDESNNNAHESIRQWEERCNSISVQLEESGHIHAKNQNLFEKVEALEEELVKTKVLIPTEDQVEKCKTLSIRIGQLELQTNEKDEAITMYEEDAAEVMKRMEEDREAAEDALSQWKSTADELENTVESLQQQLHENIDFVKDQKLEAEEAIAHWEDRCCVLEEQMEEQEKQLDESEDRIIAQDEEIKELQQADTMIRSMLESSEARIMSLTKDIEYNNARSEEERKVLIAEIESRVEQSLSLEVELNGAQTSYEDFIVKIKEYKDLLMLEQRARVSTDELLRSERNRTNQLQLSLKSEMAVQTQTEMKCKTMISKYKAKQEAAEERWKKAQIEVGELQGEMQKRVESLSSINTDKASLKATEMATYALRRQIAELQTKLKSEKKKLEQEQDSRKTKEDELDKLKNDLALLSHAEESLGNNICGDGQLRKLASKAADDIFRKERGELEELRSTLKNATDEVHTAKAAVKDAEKEAASLRIHASMCEKEVIASKNDVSFLNKTIEVLRSSESNNLHALQTRIADLESDRQSIAHAHLNDLERMKAELSQSNNEKDRLLHALHESEKTNAALVVTETMSKAKDNSSDTNALEMELARLKIANAQLLAAVAETGSKTEKRIRAAVAAHAASSEAELLLEKDLLESSEKVCEDLQQKLDELREKMKHEGQENTISPAKAILNERMKGQNASKEVEALKEEVQKLNIDCKNGTEKNVELEKDVNEAKKLIAELRRKCDRLASQSREANRDVSFEATIASEIAQLRVESSIVPHNTDEFSQVMIHVNHNKHTGRSLNQMTADEMYDLVTELKDAVSKERNLYRDLMVDHEELLAVLAEQDIEIDVLRSGLENFGGEEVLQNTLKAVEANLDEKVRGHNDSKQ